MAAEPYKRSEATCRHFRPVMLSQCSHHRKTSQQGTELCTLKCVGSMQKYAKHHLQHQRWPGGLLRQPWLLLLWQLRCLPAARQLKPGLRRPCQSCGLCLHQSSRDHELLPKFLLGRQWGPGSPSSDDITDRTWQDLPAGAGLVPQMASRQRLQICCACQHRVNYQNSGRPGYAIISLFGCITSMYLRQLLTIP